MLADFQNVGGFPKCWRIYKILVLSKMLADFPNIGAFQKYRRIYKNVGVWQKYRLTIESWRALKSLHGGISADLEKVGGPLTVWARRNLQLLTSSWTG
jgi:hypothetical protein